MIPSNYQWQLKASCWDESQLDQLQEELAYSRTFLKVCLQKGLDHKEAIERFIHHEHLSFYDPYLLHDMEKAVLRINQAIEQHQRILIYGDYDADGITSTTIMYETLQILGAQVEYFLPNRFVDGYGPNRDVYQYYIDQHGIDLIITVDNGVAGHEAIAYAKERSVDVIVTDHHELGETLPCAYAIIHPRHPEGAYPFPELAGAGVAFKLAHAILGELPMDLLEVCMIGTVADLVPLVDENRLMVKMGLQMMAQTDRLSLIQFMEQQEQPLTAELIAFQLAPRLNALGRIADANEGVAWLTSFDEVEAQALLEKMDATNQERRQIVDQITSQAIDKVRDQYAGDLLPHVIVVYEPSWHEGVIGIVASRLVEHFHRPTVVLTYNEKSQLAKGSARSLGTFSLADAFFNVQQTLEVFGGHQMAAGLSLTTDQISAFTTAINQYAKTLAIDFEQKMPIEVTCLLDLTEVNLAFAKELALLSPFGTGNPKPVFKFTEVLPRDVKAIGANQDHLKLSLDQAQASCQAIGFGFGGQAGELMAGDAISVLGEVDINTWQGREMVQLRLVDLASNQIPLLDARSTKLDPRVLAIDQAVVLYQHPKAEQVLAQRLPETSCAVPYGDVALARKYLTPDKSLVLFDCPLSKEVLAAQLEGVNCRRIIVCAYPLYRWMDQGLPSRQQMGKLYHYLKQLEGQPIAKHKAKVSQFLGIPLLKFTASLKILEEAHLIQANEQSGYQILPPASQKKPDLSQTPTYLQYEQALLVEQQLIYHSFNQVSTWLKTLIETNKEEEIKSEP